MILDIAKESADVFPPLKSCLGGINALIKHYEVRWYHISPPIPLTIINQQYKDVEDKLDDLTPWLEKLLQTLAKANPNDDPEETERRSQLARVVLRMAYRANRS